MFNGVEKEFHQRMTGLDEFFSGVLEFDKACKDIGKEEKDFKATLEELNKWLELQKHLPQNAISERHLEKFLLGAKGDLDRAKFRVDSYFSARNLVASIFSERDPSTGSLLNAGQVMYTFFLPELTPDGSRVLWIRVRQEDPGLFELVPYLRRVFAVLDVWLRTELLPTCGLYVVVDDKPTSLGHVMKASPSRIREAVYLIQNVYPVRLQGIAFINVHHFMKTMLTKFILPLFKKKIAKRFSFYSEDHSSLYATIPQSMIPSDYGGQSHSLEQLNQKWLEMVDSDRDWLMSGGTATSNESLRKGKCPISGPGCIVM